VRVQARNARGKDPNTLLGMSGLGNQVRSSCELPLTAYSMPSVKD
jgi:hypothetical protein